MTVLGAAVRAATSAGDTIREPANQLPVATRPTNVNTRNNQKKRFLLTNFTRQSLERS